MVAKNSKQVPVVCNECGKKFKTASICPVCPKCKGSDIDVR
jgi:predicted Zn-ribbon and HTH transcriptional regulator